MTRLGSLALALVFSVGCVGGTDAPAVSGAEADVAAPGGGDPATTAALRGTAPAASGLIPSVVMLRPADDGAVVDPTAPPAVRAEPKIDQFGLQFSPSRLVVDVDAPLVFTNSEGALAHNVHVRSIDTGHSLINEDANSGDELELTLLEAGGYDVLCDMHPGMTAFVFATDQPYVVLAEPDGTFTFPGVGAGTYHLRLWTAEAGFADPVRVTVPPEGVDVDLHAPS
jgi:plastocyanin